MTKMTEPRGFIDSINRKGQKERYPIISLSIAFISNEYYPIKHIGQISAIAAEIKSVQRRSREVAAQRTYVDQSETSRREMFT